MEIVVNRCYGGFGLSHKAIMRYAELKGFKLYAFHEEAKRFVEGVGSSYTHYSRSPLEPDGTYWSVHEIERNDPALVQVVRELGKEANGHYAKLGIVDIPDGVSWEIEDYDGIERISERHRTWW